MTILHFVRLPRQISVRNAFRSFQSTNICWTTSNAFRHATLCNNLNQRIPHEPLSIRRFSNAPAQNDQNNSSQTNKGHMIIGFTCKVCSNRMYKPMSKQAYNHGVVIIRCDGCKSLHLIADHLGWFDTTQGPPGTIEDIMSRKGETVVKLQTPSSLKLAADSINASSPESNASSIESNASNGSMQESADSGMLEWIPKAIAEAEAAMETSNQLQESKNNQ